MTKKFFYASGKRWQRILWLACLTVLYPLAFAQNGHPLVGSWSGNWTAAGQQGRLLVLIEFNADQVISGNIIEGSVRAPITEATLNPDDWSVTLKGQQKDASGAMVSIEIAGVIENLGSTTERAIVGSWRKGSTSGDLRLTLN